MELRELVQAVRHRWYIIATLTVWFGAIAGAYTAMQPPMYTATAHGMVSVGNPQNRPPYALASGAQYILDRMTSYAELGVTTPVLTPVVNDLNLDETPLSLSGRVNSRSIVGMAVLDVSVSYNDPKVAATIADRTITEVGRAINRLENGNVQLAPTGAAIPPVQPSNQRVVVTSVVAASGGLVLGCLIAVALQLLAGHRQQGRRSLAATGAGDE